MMHILEDQPRPLRRKNLRLGMMHYHLKSGGVVSVMRDLAQALGRFGRYGALEVDILSSVDSRTEAEWIFEPIQGTGRTGRIIHIPGLAYHDTPYPSRMVFTWMAYQLALQVLEDIDLERSVMESPYILHAHNISLGKSPLATAAFSSIAALSFHRSLPLWLINHVHDFAENNRPDRMKALQHCTGRFDPLFIQNMMYPKTPNVLYVTINSEDVENLLMLGIRPDRIFLLPDPIDTEKLERKPLWKEEEWRAEGLPRADYRAMLIKALDDFAKSTSQIYDPTLPILIVPMKVMRRKNIIEALLLLVLFERMGRRFQLLISLDANSPPDIEYSHRLKRFAKARSLPVLIGFGNRLVSSGQERLIRDGKPESFSVVDTISLSEAVLTTSIVEGFGFVFHEGWLCGKAVIGRKIPEVVRDFESNGMSFKHMYDRFAISLLDLPDLRRRLLRAYERLVRRLREPEAQPLTVLSPKDILDAKIFSVDGEECIDFADLDAEMQFEVIDASINSPAFADRLVQRNPALHRMAGLLNSRPIQLIQSNREAVRAHYSLQAAARRLERLFETGDALYRERDELGELSPKGQAAVLQKYRRPEKIRLLLESDEATGERRIA